MTVGGVISTLIRVWIGQGKPTIFENYRFVQQTRNIAIQFLMDLKAQSKHRIKNCPIWMYTKLFEVKKWLNMESKTDKEGRRGDDIGFLSEIITNFIRQETKTI